MAKGHSHSNNEKMVKRKMEIVLPIPMPTWNILLAANPWKRKKIRDSIHQFVLYAIRTEKGLQTRTGSATKQPLMELLKLEYLQMIRPKKSTKSFSSKPKVRKKKQ